LGDVVNLKRFRKRNQRDQAAKQAEANRLRFGRTRAERTIEEDRARRASELLDHHHIDGKDAS
jgi:hypothetical protein